MKRADLITVSHFPVVIQAAEVRHLRQEPQLLESTDFVSGYLGADARSRHALTEILAALHESQRGMAFWLNGVFGSGKSHLLGLVALLADGTGHQAFLQNHAIMAPLLENWPRRLVVHFSLDEYAAAEWTLEAVVWREITLEWRRLGLAGPLPEEHVSRGDKYRLLEERLAEQGLGGLVLCVDELSLFLGGKEHIALQQDAAFLQFLGQHCQRYRVWFVGALQKTVEDIGGLESYSLTQIRDRFVLLHLGQTHLKKIVSARLVRPKDETALSQLSLETYQTWLRLFPRIPFGTDEWRETYPFHPQTLDLLEAVTARFFSRTRSALMFCQSQLQEEGEAAARITAEEIFDFFKPDLETHPDLRPLENVWRSWEQSAPLIAGPTTDPQHILRVMKAVLVWKLAGLAATPVQLANVLGLDAGLGGEGNYEYVRHLLERIRTRGSYLVVDRADELYQDRYSVDLGQRVSEMARRHIRAGMEALAPLDPRVAPHVSQCCQGEPLPLGQFVEPGSVALYWRNSARRILVELYDAQSPMTLANRVNSLQEAGVPEEALLLIVPPFNVREVDREALFAALQEGETARLWLWEARVPLRDEWEVAREWTASVLLETDPVLEDNRRGRALVEYLKKEAPARRERTARMAHRLLREGTITTCGGVTIEAGELVRGDTWPATLESVAEFGFPRIFPKFSQLAPRSRLLTPSNAESLCLELLRRPLTDPWFSASLERLVRNVAEPLGLAIPRQGRWQMAPGQQELIEQVLHTVGEGSTLARLEHAMGSGSYGLKAEQVHMVVCAMLRSGHLVGQNAQGQALSPGQVGLPLGRSLHQVQPGILVGAGVWQAVSVLLEVLTGTRPGALSYGAQEQARAVLQNFAEKAEAELQLAQARVAQLRRQLGHSAAQWPVWETTCRQLADIIFKIQGATSTPELFQEMANWNASGIKELLRSFAAAGEALEAHLGQVLACHALLTSDRLQVSGELAEARSTLLLQLQNGEEFLTDSSLLDSLSRFQTTYAAAYREWHEAQHNPARWNSLRRILASDVFLALERLGTLVHRPFPHAEGARALLARETGQCCTASGEVRGAQAVCPGCQLGLGERVAVPSPLVLEEALVSGLSQLQNLLKESEVSTFLSRVSCPLAEWDGAPATLLPLLTPASLRLLDDALRPRRCATRNLWDLQQGLEGCVTVAQWRQVLKTWLEGDDLLADEDQLVLVADGAGLGGGAGLAGEAGAASSPGE